MKRKFWMVAAALLALALCGTAMISYAQQNEGTAAAPEWSGHKHGHMEYLARELNLTDAQKEQIKSLLQSQKNTLRPLMQQLATNREAMLTATANGAFDQAKVTAIANQQAQVMAQLTVQKESMKHQIYTQVLTAEQRAKADELRQKQMDRLNQHLQKWSQDGTDSHNPPN